MSATQQKKQTHRPSVCPLDCPDTCSLVATVENGEITKVRGSKVNSLTSGVICKKVSKYYPDFIHGEQRLTTPLKRTGKRGSGEYQQISWDEALELCHQGIQKAIDKYGSESVLPLNYCGPHGQLASGSMDRRFFYRLGATQLNRAPLCAGVRGMAYSSLFGDSCGMPQQQAEHSDLIVVWGSNTSTTFLHLMKIINKARNKGAKVIVIDPNRIKVAKIADLYLQITPGSDAYFALAIAAEFERLGLINHDALAEKVSGLDKYLNRAKDYQLEKIQSTCGIDNSQVFEFLQLMKNAKRIAMMVGVGLERTINGGSAIRSAMTLPILLGQFGQRGQGCIGFYAKAFAETTAKLQRPDLLKEETRTFNIVDVADHILDKNAEIPVKAVFIYNHNPVCTHPDQNKMRKALSNEGVFIVGSDITMTDSMKYADVILPAASHFEHNDVYASYGHTYLQRAEAVINPVGEALPNTEIFRRLGALFGFDEKAFNETDEQLQEQAFDLSGHDCKVNKAADIEIEETITMGELDAIWLSDLDEKITLHNEELQQQYGFGLPRYQEISSSFTYRLLTPPSPFRSNSTFGGNDASMGLAEVEINPEDAKVLGIESNQKVRLKNNKGEVILKAKVTTDIASGVVCSHKGTWCESSPTGQTVQALIDNQSRTDIGGGAAFYDTFVEIEAV